MKNCSFRLPNNKILIQVIKLENSYAHIPSNVIQHIGPFIQFQHSFFLNITDDGNDSYSAYYSFIV